MWRANQRITQQNGAHVSIPIHFIDEGQPRDIVSTHLTVDGDRLRLDTRDGAQNQDGSVKHSQGALNLDRKIDVTCCIERECQLELLKRERQQRATHPVCR